MALPHRSFRDIFLIKTVDIKNTEMRNTGKCIIPSHLTLALQIPNLLLLQFHVHAELLTLRLQLSDTTTQRVSRLHSVGHGGRTAA